jgi:hypothetical protein
MPGSTIAELSESRGIDGSIKFDRSQLVQGKGELLPVLLIVKFFLSMQFAQKKISKLGQVKGGLYV